MSWINEHKGLIISIIEILIFVFIDLVTIYQYLVPIWGEYKSFSVFFFFLQNHLEINIDVKI